MLDDILRHAWRFEVDKLAEKYLFTGLKMVIVFTGAITQLKSNLSALALSISTSSQWSSSFLLNWLLKNKPKAARMRDNRGGTMIKKKIIFLGLGVVLVTILLSRALISNYGRSEIFHCTIIMTARDGLVLVGNNEDRNHSQTKITFIPATEKYYGRIIFGFDDAPFQGGMNDQGLFIDGNRVASTGWQPEPGKRMFMGSVITFLLGTCATCEEVKNFFKTHNVPALDRARFPVADRAGAAMVVEFAQGKTRFITSETWYLISTNFIMSNIKNGRYPCWRYRTADKILAKADKLNLKLIRKVLEKTSQKGNAFTIYSNIYDLKKGIIYIYKRQNFDDVVVLDLVEELKKGQRQIDLPSLFKHK